jgi:uncharacterized protein Veg
LLLHQLSQAVKVVPSSPSPSSIEGGQIEVSNTGGRGKEQLLILMETHERIFSKQHTTAKEACIHESYTYTYRDPTDPAPS